LINRRLRKIAVHAFGSRWIQVGLHRLKYIIDKLVGFGSAGNPNISGETALLSRLSGDWRGRVVTVFDVGGNVGQFLRAIGGSVPCLDGFRIVTFEPNPTCWPSLELACQEVSARGAETEILKAAVGSLPGRLVIYANGPADITASAHRAKDPLTSPIQAECTTVDEIIRSRGIECLDLLKIDTEGHEFHVLMGATQALEQGRIRSILFEFGEHCVQSRVFLKDYFELLGKHGYVLHRLLPSGRLWEVPTWTEDLEIFKCTLYFATKPSKSPALAGLVPPFSSSDAAS
jgi:FkbM family methyltransferase